VRAGIRPGGASRIERPGAAALPCWTRAKPDTPARYGTCVPMS